MKLSKQSLNRLKLFKMAEETEGAGKTKKNIIDEEIEGAGETKKNIIDEEETSKDDLLKRIRLLNSYKHEVHLLQADLVKISYKMSYDFPGCIMFFDKVLQPINELYRNLDNWYIKRLTTPEPNRSSLINLPPKLIFEELPNDEIEEAEEHFSKANLLNSLIKLSDSLDKDDLTKYSNFVDSLIKKIS